MLFLAQIIGSIAVSFWVVSIQVKERKNVLLFQSVANFLYFVEYFLLGAFSASLMNLVSTCRCFMFAKVDNKKSFCFLLLFVFLILFIGVFTYDGVLSLIPIVISVFYTLSSFNSNAKWNRFCVLFLAFVWIYYNFKVEAYISILGNLMEIVSGILALVRFKD